jgi:NAD(P)-dependent dehydrogenase (short-subunit alcohol dehydrogenase family)
LDVAVANAGIATWGRFWEMPVDRWRDMIDINLTGAFNTLGAAVPAMIEAGNGGSIVCISSVAGHQVAAGDGALQRRQARRRRPGQQCVDRVGALRIRVHTVHPWGVVTPMAETGSEAGQDVKR